LSNGTSDCEEIGVHRIGRTEAISIISQLIVVCVRFAFLEERFNKQCHEKAYVHTTFPVDGLILRPNDFPLVPFRVLCR
jgi:hypothetical protein